MSDPVASSYEQITNRAKLYERTVNRLCKWRTVLVGWFLGTKADDSPGVKAWRDMMDNRLIVRVEVSAITALLIEKGAFTVDEFKSQVVIECDEMQKMLEAQFPGHVAIENGISISPPLALETYKRLGFPQ